MRRARKNETAEHGKNGLAGHNKVRVNGDLRITLIAADGSVVFESATDFVKNEETEHGGADQTDEAHEKQPVTDFFFHAPWLHSSFSSSLSASL